MTDDRKVLSFRTRRPVDEVEQEVPVEAAAAGEVHIDTDTVGVAEHMLKLAKSGDYSGCLVVAWDRANACFFTDLVLPEDDHVDNSALKFSGMLDVVKEQLREIVRECFATERHDR